MGLRAIILFLGLLLGRSGAADEFMPGDIILLELNCPSCRLIAEETQSRFSHSGLVLRSPSGELRVLESLRMVEDVSLESFLARQVRGSSAVVMRSFDYQTLQPLGMQTQMWTDYKRHWWGLPFDSKFLWDNYHEQGPELLYCSEFIAKFLDHYLAYMPGAPTPMDYSLHWDQWLFYFQGRPPQGKLGNNPASFYRDPQWFKAFEWQPILR